MIVGISNILLIFIWIYWRSNPLMMAGSKIGIIFAPHYNRECNSLIHNLFNEFENTLKNSKYSSNFEIKFLPEYKTIQNHNDASDLIQRTKARIIIFGYYNTGKIQMKVLKDLHPSLLQ